MVVNILPKRGFLLEGNQVVTARKYGDYIKKTIKFGGKTLELFSIDGATWSSRPAELAEIKSRLAAQSVAFGASMKKNPQPRPAYRPGQRPQGELPKQDSKNIVPTVVPKALNSVPDRMAVKKGTSSPVKRSQKTETHQKKRTDDPAPKKRQSTAPKKKGGKKRAAA